MYHQTLAQNILASVVTTVEFKSWNYLPPHGAENTSVVTTVEFKLRQHLAMPLLPHPSVVTTVEFKSEQNYIVVEVVVPFSCYYSRI